MQIDCYAVYKTPPELAAAKVIAKALLENKRVLVRIEGEAASKAFDDYLWTHEPASFIPHAREGAGAPKGDDAPVLIVSGAEKSAGEGRPYLVLLGAANKSDIRGFERVFWFLSRFDEEILQAARELCRSESAAGATARFWLQGEKNNYAQEDLV